MSRKLIAFELIVFLFFLASIFGCTREYANEAIEFTNPIVESFVRKQLGKSENEPMTADELLGVKSFYYYDSEGEEFDLHDFLLMPNMELLAIEGVSLQNEEVLSSLHHLTVLGLDKCNFDLLPSLVEATQLETLGVSYSSVNDVSALKDVHGLKSLDIVGTELTDLSVLAGMNQLEVLHANRTGVKDISPLQSVPNLRELDLRWTFVEDLSPLMKLKNLKELHLRKSEFSKLYAQGNENATKQYEELRDALPDCEILID